MVDVSEVALHETTMGVDDLHVEAAAQCGSLATATIGNYRAISGALAARMPEGTRETVNLSDIHVSAWGFEVGEEQLWISVTALPVEIGHGARSIASELKPIWARRLPGASAHGLGSDRGLHRLAVIAADHDPMNRVLSPVLYVYAVSPEGLVHAIGFHVSRAIVDENRMGCVAAMLPIARSIGLRAQPTTGLLSNPSELLTAIGHVSLDMPGRYLWNDPAGKSGRSTTGSLSLVRVGSATDYPRTTRLTIKKGTLSGTAIEEQLYERKETPTRLLGGKGTCRHGAEKNLYGEVTAVCRTRHQHPSYAFRLSAPSKNKLRKLMELIDTIRIRPVTD